MNTFKLAIVFVLLGVLTTFNALTSPLANKISTPSKCVVEVANYTINLKNIVAIQIVDNNLGKLYIRFHSQRPIDIEAPVEMYHALAERLKLCQE